jgi:hypothetical protein
MDYFEVTLHVGNTSNHTYLYKLEFWGLITILAFVLTSTNWDFGA